MTVDSLKKLKRVYSFTSLGDQFYQFIQPSGLDSSYWVHSNRTLIKTLGLDEAFENKDNLAIASGMAELDRPLAMVYAGHQFGGFSAQLGDGRGALIGQIETASGIVDLHLKGIGKTPYSRFGDGRAVLRSSIREYLAGEAMTQLNITSTRALCLVGSHQPVQRETTETAAMLLRTAKTHIRFGHFEFFHYNRQPEQVKQLADHVIEQFIPEAIGCEDQYQQLLLMAITNTATMIAHWQSVGFAHGVMNTDNFSIIGETLDYGPYSFLDDYEPELICNHSDHTGRYRFDQQPSIGLWNCYALAEALGTLVTETQAKELLDRYEPILVKQFAVNIRGKFGLSADIADSNNSDDQSLCHALLHIMAKQKVDYTGCFRALCDYKMGLPPPKRLTQLFKDSSPLIDWCKDYDRRLALEPANDETRQQAMKQVNPWYILRNCHLQQAIVQAESGDFSEIDRLYTLVSQPFIEHPTLAHYADPPPSESKYLSISCSS